MSVKSNSDADDVFVVWALDESWQMGEAKWVEGRVFIEESHQEKEYSVVITTKKGSNDQSYVAFDQVAFIQTENCELKPPEAMPVTTTTMAPTPPTTTPPKQWHECNFEKEDLCGWQVFPSPPDFPFQWERTNGKLLADNSVEGPQHDHDEQNQSKFTRNQNVSLYLFFLGNTTKAHKSTYGEIIYIMRYYGLGLNVWIFKCLFKLPFRVNVFSQKSHLKGFSPA